MNLRHAAALALVGWYLMVPPEPPPDGMSDPSTPLSRWHTIGSFDCAQACERIRAAAIEKEPRKLRRAAEQNALCIASDDPRLKEK